MNTRLDIDRAIAAACDLHDDRSLESGTRRPDRQQPPQTILDASPGDAGLDLDPDGDLDAETALVARSARASNIYFDLEEPVRHARYAALLVMLALEHHQTMKNRESRDALDYAVMNSVTAAEDAHRLYQSS